MCLVIKLNIGVLEDRLKWCILDWPSSEWIIFNETFLPTGTMGNGRFRKECPLGRVCGIWRGEKSVPRKVRKTLVFIQIIIMYTQK